MPSHQNYNPIPWRTPETPLHSSETHAEFTLRKRGQMISADTLSSQNEQAGRGLVGLKALPRIKEIPCNFPFLSFFLSFFLSLFLPFSLSFSLPFSPIFPIFHSFFLGFNYLFVFVVCLFLNFLLSVCWDLLNSTCFQKRPALCCAEHCTTLYIIHQGKLRVFSSNFCQYCRHQHNAIMLADTFLVEGAHVLSHLIAFLQESWLRFLGIQPFCRQILFHLSSNAPLLAGQLMCLSLKLTVQMFQQVKSDSTSVRVQ